MAVCMKKNWSCTFSLSHLLLCFFSSKFVSHLLQIGPKTGKNIRITDGRYETFQNIIFRSFHKFGQTVKCLDLMEYQTVFRLICQINRKRAITIKNWFNLTKLRKWFLCMNTHINLYILDTIYKLQTLYVLYGFHVNLLLYSLFQLQTIIVIFAKNFSFHALYWWGMRTRNPNLLSVVEIMKTAINWLENLTN